MTTLEVTVRNTTDGVIARLEARGLVVRNVSPNERRVRLVTPTPKDIEILDAAVPRMLKSQDRLLEPLTKTEHKEFVRLMKILVDANAELSNIPTKE